MDSNVRPVWITREQRDRLYDNYFNSIAYAWDRAPADATEAVEGVIGHEECPGLTEAVLHALRMPK